MAKSALRIVWLTLLMSLLVLLVLIASLGIRSSRYDSRPISPPNNEAFLKEQAAIFMSCRDTPPNVRHELNGLFEKKSSELFLGGATRLVSPQLNSRKSESALYLLNGESCRGAFCRAHLFWFSSDRTATDHGCGYALSFHMPKEAAVVSSVVRPDKAEYSTECNLYYQGFCF